MDIITDSIDTDKKDSNKPWKDMISWIEKMVKVGFEPHTYWALGIDDLILLPRLIS